MKRIIGMLIACVMIVFGCTSCQLQPEQITTIAENAGLYAAVIWISVDDPDTSLIKAVSSILIEVEAKADEVESGESYAMVLYPDIVEIIDTKIAEKDRGFCKAGVLSLLSGLDTLFIMHPEWQKSQDIALKVVSAFISGAQQGFGLSEDNPVIVQARAVAKIRKYVYSK